MQNRKGKREATRFYIFLVNGNHNSGIVHDFIIDGHLDLDELSENLHDEFGNEIVEIALSISAIDSPVRYVDKIRVQMFHTYHDRKSLKENHKTFTVYGMSADQVKDKINNYLNKSLCLETSSI